MKKKKLKNLKYKKIIAIGGKFPLINSIKWFQSESESNGRHQLKKPRVTYISVRGVSLHYREVEKRGFKSGQL